MSDAPPPPPGYGYGPPAAGGPPPPWPQPEWQPTAWQPNPWQPMARPKAGSDATGPLPLHPMSVGDILDGVFKLLKANFRTIAIIVGCVLVPGQILVAFLQRNTLGGRGILTVIRDPSTTSRSSNNLTPVLISLAANVVLLPLVGAAVAKVVAASYVGGEMGPADALKATVRKAPSLFAAWLTWHPVEIIGFALCIFPGVAWMTLFVMVAPAIVIEDLSFWKGLKRSWHLASSRYWPTMGVVLLAGLIATVMSNILGGVPNIVALLIGLRWGWLLVALGGALSSLIVAPIAGITATLLYFDARIRTEGFDLQMIAAGMSRGEG